MAWISVRNWRKFQHYDPAKRRPVWIKNHLELLASDEYRDLTGHQRAVLHGLWLEYASSRCQLLLNTSSLSSRINLRVMTRDIESLNHAGFIDIVASKLLADGYQDASLEVEVEKKKKDLAVDVTSNGAPVENPVHKVNKTAVADLVARTAGAIDDIPF